MLKFDSAVREKAMTKSKEEWKKKRKSKKEKRSVDMHRVKACLLLIGRSVHRTQRPPYHKLPYSVSDPE